jgi:atypical dual specificity phosphatase
MLKNDAIKLCQENNFNSGFFEGSDSHTVVDAYELKVSELKMLCRIIKVKPFIEDTYS